jgi:hypothetical protein
MGKFTYGAPAVKRVTAGAGFDEDWFDLRDSLTQGDVIAASETTNNMERGSKLAFALIHAWSITDDKGAAVPLSYETFMRLPLAMVEPIYSVVGSADFLQRT